jgi:hypothetical protein
MIFNVISSTVGITKYGNADGYRAVSFEVVPEGRAYLEIGDEYVLSSAGYHDLLHHKRKLVRAKVHVTDDENRINRVDQTSGPELCGWASFYTEQDDDFGSDPPQLEFAVAIPPELFDDLFKMRIEAPGSATMHLDIDELEYGWEPDGSHQIWKIEEQAKKRIAQRKPVTSFWINVRTFSTTQRALAQEKDRSLSDTLADSSDPEDRKLAADLAPVLVDDAATKLLRECRMILLALLVLAAIAVFRR